MEVDVDVVELTLKTAATFWEGRREGQERQKRVRWGFSRLCSGRQGAFRTRNQGGARWGGSVKVSVVAGGVAGIHLERVRRVLEQAGDRVRGRTDVRYFQPSERTGNA